MKKLFFHLSVLKVFFCALFILLFCFAFPGYASEIFAGRLFMGEQPVDDASLEFQCALDSIFGIIKDSSREKGIFAMLTPSYLKINGVFVSSSHINRGRIDFFMDASIPRHEWSQIGKSRSTQFLDAGSVGNVETDDVFIDIAVIGEPEGSLQKAYAALVGTALPRIRPSELSSWDLQEFSVLYVEPFVNEEFLSTPWQEYFQMKISDYVRQGGKLCITGNAGNLVKYLSQRAKNGVKWDDKKFYGNNAVFSATFAGNSKTFSCYIDDKTGGSTAVSLGEAVGLAYVLSDDINHYRFPAALSFQYGKGKVWYSSFAFPDEIEDKPPEMLDFITWFLIQPLISRTSM